MTTTSKGHEGEDKAAAYLEKDGCRIIARNYRACGGELDIVAWEGNVLVFVEVKARDHMTHQQTIRAVTPAKQRKIAMAATQFIKEKGLKYDSIRFDVICVLQGVNIFHLTRAFFPYRTTL